MKRLSIAAVVGLAAAAVVYLSGVSAPDYVFRPEQSSLMSSRDGFLYVEYNRTLTSLDSVLEQWERENGYTLQPCRRAWRSYNRAAWECDAHKKASRSGT